MNPPKIQFTGILRANLDQHSRLHLGVKWSLNKETTLYLTNVQPCIRAYTKAAYDGMVHEIMDSNLLSTQKKRMLVRVLKSRIRGSAVESRNRILIPLDFVKLIDVEQAGTATLVGRGDYFEIWNPEAHEKYMRSARRKE